MESDRREALKSKVDELTDVSTIPAILTKVMAVVEDEEGTAFDLKKIIERDQSISSRVVAVANSAYYGLSGMVNSLSQAILLLGFETVKNIAVSISIFENLGSRCRLDVTDLWIHSMKVAMTSGLIAQRTGCVDKDTAFLGGLLHDIGRAVLLQIFEDEYIEVSMSGIAGLTGRETESFGANHCDVGGWLAGKYQLPDKTIDAIKYHHDPAACTPGDASPNLSKLINLVFLSDYLVSEGSEDVSDDSQTTSMDAEIPAGLGLDEAALEEIRKEVAGMDAEARQYFSS